MNTNVFIDNKKLFRSTAIGLCIFLLFLIAGLFFFIKFNFFPSLSTLNLSFIFKIACLVAYIFVAIKWAQGLIQSYELTLQKDPFMQINDMGLTFIQNNKITSIPWNQVLKVDKIALSNGVMIAFTQDAPIENQFPFGKFGPHSIVTLSYITTPYDELYANLLEYKDQFSQR